MARTVEAGRRQFTDPRLAIGLALVAVSVAGVVGVVMSIDDRTTVYAASEALAPGDRVESGDLVERSVSLDGADELYVRAGELPAEGLVVVRTVREGELLPRASVGDGASVSSTAIVIELASPPSSAVRPGASVDVWTAPFDAASREFGAPLVLVPDAVVARAIEREGLVGASSGGAVELLVLRGRIAAILQAQADGDALAVLPAGLPWGG